MTWFFCCVWNMSHRAKKTIYQTSHFSSHQNPGTQIIQSIFISMWRVCMGIDAVQFSFKWCWVPLTRGEVEFLPSQALARNTITMCLNLPCAAPPEVGRSIEKTQGQNPSSYCCRYSVVIEFVKTNLGCWIHPYLQVKKILSPRKNIVHYYTGIFQWGAPLILCWLKLHTW